MRPTNPTRTYPTQPDPTRNSSKMHFRLTFAFFKGTRSLLDNFEYEGKFKYEDSLKYKDNLKYEDDLKYDYDLRGCSFMTSAPLGGGGKGQPDSDIC